MHETQFVDAITPWLEPNKGPLRAHLTLAIRQAIGSGQLRQGARLPPERALATALHVSRPTVSAVMDDLRTLGLVTSRQGSGSWVSDTDPVSNSPVPFVELLQQTGSIDLAAATAPDASLLPQMRVDTADLLGAEPANGLNPQGLSVLRQRVAGRMNGSTSISAGSVSAENVVMTSGAHQALALAVAALAPRGSSILVEDTTYGGLIDMIHANGCHPIGIERDADGPLPGCLAELLKLHEPSLVILVTSVHSPTGAVSSPERSANLASVLKDTTSHVVLDETYADLEFTPGARALVQALGGSAIRIGTLSKALWTGLRTGWLIAPADTCRAIVRKRWQQFDLGPSIPSQLFAAQALEGIDRALEVRRSSLRERSDWVTNTIETNFPQWQPTKVDGGLAMWVEVPMDGADFVTMATERGVAVLPGSACRADRAPTPHIRLCFDRPLDVLEQAFDRLG